MKLFISFTTFFDSFSRTAYFERTVASLVKTKIPEIGFSFYWSDDYSASHDIIDDPQKVFPWPVKFFRNEKRLGLGVNAVKNIDRCFEDGATHVLIAEADMIVHPDWVEKVLELCTKKPDGDLWTIYNSRLHNNILEQGDGWIKKKTVGGLGLLIPFESWNTVKPNRREGWDWALVHKLNGSFYSIKKSHIQHIGANGSHSSGTVVDYAEILVEGL